MSAGCTLSISSYDNGATMKHFIAVTFVALQLAPAAAQEDAILYRYRDQTLSTGKYGPIAAFQRALDTQLKSCSPAGPHVSNDGTYGAGTRQAISRLTQCHTFSKPLPSNSPARNGAITSMVWGELLPTTPLPTPEQRANDLTLVFEATDYTALEFNYCQSRAPEKNGKTWLQGDPRCFSNDPCSFATWGPRGATVGGGQEIQKIVWQVNKSNSAIVSASFGSEYDTMKRLLRADRESGEVLLCAAFVDSNRRAAWKAAFDKLGQEAIVRKTFDDVYLSKAADGAKMINFYSVFSALKPLIKRDPTEIDYGLFLDRSTHGGSPNKAEQVQQTIAILEAYIKKLGKTPSPAELRWQLTKALPVGNQSRDRLGRDVVYVYDGLGANVGADAVDAWQHRGPFKASDFGLSDDRYISTFTAQPGSGYDDEPRSDQASAADRASCPKIVLNPQSPKDGSFRQCTPRQ